MRAPAFDLDRSPQRGNASLVRSGFPTRNNTPDAQPWHLYIRQWRAGGLRPIFTRARRLNALSKNKVARTPKRIRTVIKHVIVGHRDRIKTALIENHHHLQGLVPMQVSLFTPPRVEYCRLQCPIRISNDRKVGRTNSQYLSTSPCGPDHITNPQIRYFAIRKLTIGHVSASYTPRNQR